MVVQFVLLGLAHGLLCSLPAMAQARPGAAANG